MGDPDLNLVVVDTFFEIYK